MAQSISLVIATATLFVLVYGCQSSAGQDRTPVEGEYDVSADVRTQSPHQSHADANPDTARAASEVSTEAVADATTDATPADPRKYSERCPSGMREVEGTACEKVQHLCLEGRSVVYGKPLVPGGIWPIIATKPVHCPKGCPPPYYCDKYLEGAATCSGKQKPVHFCMDDGEYPNVAGEMPRVYVSWNEAKDLCGAQGKRLCGDDEWTFACEGPEHLPFSYGWERDPNRCYIDHPKAAGPQPVLSSPDCTSPFGVHDLNGNVDEWCQNVTLGGKPHPSIFKGGHWVGPYGARNNCRVYTESHGPTFSFYAEGFRCCADAAASTH